MQVGGDAMPMHDWTRVEPNYLHDFHVGWIAAFRLVLNNGGLPPGYYALAGQDAPPFEPDVLALEVPAPQGRSNGVALTPSPGPAPSGVTLATSPPQVRFTAAEPKAGTVSRKQRRIAIRHSSTHRLVAVIEIVSPGNKANKREFLRFVDRALLLLEQHVHLLLIDPFPPTARDLHGIHAAIWRKLVRKRFTPPADKPLTLVSYAVDADQFTAYIEPIAVGDRLPNMPLFLTPTHYVNVPLEETYTQAWAGFPVPWRGVVEGR
jgi:hypothetical protein